MTPSSFIDFLLEHKKHYGMTKRIMGAVDMSSVNKIILITEVVDSNDYDDYRISFSNEELKQATVESVDDLILIAGYKGSFKAKFLNIGERVLQQI